MIAALIASIALQQTNTLTSAETLAGWKLLFDGRTTAGWRNFKSSGIKSGWKVIDGELVCADPNNAGDIVTTETFDWFDLVIDFKLGPGGNSGVMFRVAPDGEATWHSGPEIQLYDHAQEPGVETTGFLYQLYAPKVDAAKPAGEWNTMRVLVSKEKCATWVNGVLYYEYVFGSEDFWARVAKSKFARYPGFAKTAKGSIALQGDHGHVSFRNIKVRPLRAAVRAQARDFRGLPGLTVGY